VTPRAADRPERRDTSALELRATPDALLDEPLAASVRGAGSAPLTWRARLRDDDGRVWRASAPSPGELAAAWEPAKGSTGELAALQSLRPVALDVRAESSDGRAASRTLTRRLLADGVRARRWRDGITATLFLPASAPTAAVVVAAGAATERTAAANDAPALPAAGAVGTAPLVTATAGAASLPSAALLASRGVLLVAVSDPRDLDRAAELLTQVPVAATAGPVRRLDAPLPLPPGLPARTAPDVQAWDALLATLGARPRVDGR